MKSKKGEVTEWLEQIPYILLTVVVMAVIFFLVNYFLGVSVDVTPVRVNNFYYRMIYGPNAISYTDERGHVQAGLVDLEQLNEERLSNAYILTNKRSLSAKIEIFDESERSVAQTYYNRLWYQRLEPIAKANWIGKSGAKIYQKEAPVTIKEKGVLIPGKLRMTVIIPNG